MKNSETELSSVERLVAVGARAAASRLAFGVVGALLSCTLAFYYIVDSVVSPLSDRISSIENTFTSRNNSLDIALGNRLGSIEDELRKIIDTSSRIDERTSSYKDEMIDVRIALGVIATDLEHISDRFSEIEAAITKDKVKYNTNRRNEYIKNINLELYEVSVDGGPGGPIAVKWVGPEGSIEPQEKEIVPTSPNEGELIETPRENETSIAEEKPKHEPTEITGEDDYTIAGDVVIMDSTSDNLLAGEMVPSGKFVHIPAGAFVTLIMPDGETRVVVGPYTGHIRYAESSTDTLEGLTASRGGENKKHGALEASEGAIIE